MKQLFPFVCGLLFGGGLLLSGMTRADKVLGFLDVSGVWDPSLGLVMGGALLVHGVAWRLLGRRPAPWIGASFDIPLRRDIDLPLVGGAALFGAGWGLGGFCPGPAVVAAAGGGREALVVLGAMLLGLLMVRGAQRARAGQAPPDVADA